MGGALLSAASSALQPPAPDPANPGRPGRADQAWVMCSPGSGQAGRTQQAPRRRPRVAMAASSLTEERPPALLRACISSSSAGQGCRPMCPRRLPAPGKGPPCTATVCSLSRLCVLEAQNVIITGLAPSATHIPTKLVKTRRGGESEVTGARPLGDHFPTPTVRLPKSRAG